MLTDDEAVVLEIAAHGERMIPIGRWEAPVKSLRAKGFMEPRPMVGDPSGHFNNIITEAGKKALQDWNTGTDEQFRHVIETGLQIRNAHEQVRQSIEEAAKHFVIAIKASMAASGHSESYTIQQWLKALEIRAQELLENEKSR